jgi:hypothetical protein
LDKHAKIAPLSHAKVLANRPAYVALSSDLGAERHEASEHARAARLVGLAEQCDRVAHGTQVGVDALAKVIETAHEARGPLAWRLRRRANQEIKIYQHKLFNGLHLLKVCQYT